MSLSRSCQIETHATAWWRVNIAYRHSYMAKSCLKLWSNTIYRWERPILGKSSKWKEHCRCSHPHKGTWGYLAIIISTGFYSWNHELFKKQHACPIYVYLLLHFGHIILCIYVFVSVLICNTYIQDIRNANFTESISSYTYAYNTSRSLHNAYVQLPSYVCIHACIIIMCAV